MNSKSTTSLGDAWDMAAEYSRIYTSIGYCGTNHLKLVQEMIKFRDAVTNIVKVNAPDYLDPFQKIVQKFNRVCELAGQISNSETRCSEDLRDVVERFQVVARISREHYHLMTTADKTAADLTLLGQKKRALITTAKWEEEGARIESQISSARANRENALNAAKQKTEELIEAQVAYQNFKLRRMKHAWLQFAQTIRECSAEAASLFAEISEDLANICKP